MSRSGKLVLAAESDHQIYLYQPEVVVDAIRAVFSAARRPSK